MAVRLPDGSIQMADGRVLYANSVILAQDLLELLPLFTPPPAWPFVSGGGGGGGGGNGTPGARGADGAPGAPGAQGPQGTNPGVQGPQGNDGSQGLQGNQGYQGLLGLQGMQGLAGPQGNQGFQGAQGDEGPQGFQGIQGLQGTNPGVQGPQGFQGVQGSGVEGTQGFQGNQGLQGTNPGVQGPQGFQGFQGDVGAGVQGPQGPQGSTGPQGAQGNQGIAALTTTARFTSGLTCVGVGCTATFSTGALGFTPRYARLTLYDNDGAGTGAVDNIDCVGAFVGTAAGDQSVVERVLDVDQDATIVSTTGRIGRVFNTSDALVSVTCTAFGAGGITISATAGGIAAIPVMNRFLLVVYG